MWPRNHALWTQSPLPPPRHHTQQYQVQCCTSELVQWLTWHRKTEFFSKLKLYVEWSAYLKQKIRVSTNRTNTFMYLREEGSRLIRTPTLCVWERDRSEIHGRMTVNTKRCTRVTMDSAQTPSFLISYNPQHDRSAHLCSASDTSATYFRLLRWSNSNILWKDM